MPNPWSKMSEEEYDRKKNAMNMVMMAGGLIVVVLFVVQLSVTFRKPTSEVKHDPFVAWHTFFNSIEGDTKQSKEDIDKLSDSIAEVLDLQIKQATARDAVINIVSENINKEDLNSEDVSDTDVSDSGEWEFDEEVLETQ